MEEMIAKKLKESNYRFIFCFAFYKVFF